MSDENIELVKNLDKLLFEDTGETAAEIRQRLESEGIDVAALVTRVREASGDAFRNRLNEEAAAEQNRRREKRGRIFGDLAVLGREKLLELLNRAEGGEFGQVAMARCRNQKSETMSELDLRSLLEDIESTIDESQD